GIGFETELHRRIRRFPMQTVAASRTAYSNRVSKLPPLSAFVRPRPHAVSAPQPSCVRLARRCVMPRTAIVLAPDRSVAERTCLSGGATITTTPAAAHIDFTTGEGLRSLLTRIHDAGRTAWRSDRDVPSLMDYTATKYAPLARKHGLDAWEGASAAFDVMRTPSVLRADDPWGVVTRAVQITCIAEARANGMLCSTHQARRPQFSVFHDAE